MALVNSTKYLKRNLERGQTEPGLVAFYDIRRNGTGLFLQLGVKANKAPRWRSPHAALFVGPTAKLCVVVPLYIMTGISQVHRFTDSIALYSTYYCHWIPVSPLCSPPPKSKGGVTLQSSESLLTCRKAAFVILSSLYYLQRTLAGGHLHQLPGKVASSA